MGSVVAVVVEEHDLAPELALEAPGGVETDEIEE